MPLYYDSYEAAVSVVRSSESKPGVFAKVQTKFGDKYMLDYSSCSVPAGLGLLVDYTGKIDKIIAGSADVDKKWWQFWK